MKCEDCSCCWPEGDKYVCTADDDRQLSEGDRIRRAPRWCPKRKEITYGD